MENIETPYLNELEARQNLAGDWVCEVRSLPGGLICKAYGASKKVAEDNARFIVYACNNYQSA